MTASRHRWAFRRRDHDGKPPARLKALIRRALLGVGFLCAFMTTGPAQDLNNTGAINNTGTIRVRSQATGLPPVVDGMFEFFGASQTVPARQYRDLMLTGSGTKSSAGGSFSVSGNLFVASGIVFDIQSGESLTLVGTLDEQGYLSGSIGKTVNLTGGLTTSNFGNIGASISWIANPPGQTTVTRVSGTASTGNGNQSIRRYYDVAPTFGTGLNGSMTLEYSDNELNGNNPSALELWRSPDNGLTWRRQGGTVDTATRSVTKTGIVSFSRWTAADTSQLLGPVAYEWVASSMALVSGDNQSGATGATLSPFVVTITDYYGNPIAGIPVTFSVDSIPSGATGQSLSVTSVSTNSLGQASTSLTLGNKAGVYKVAASSGSLSGSPYRFNSTATSAATAMLVVGGNSQQDTILSTLNPFTVRVNDLGGNPVPGIAVQFVILSQPVGATGATLSDTLIATNGSGLAVSYFTLGNKVGTYQVRATSPVLPGIQIDFSAQALAGTAVSLAAQSGTTAQQDTILQPLDTLFTVRLADTGGNPVSGAGVTFAITSAPVGASGQVLSASSVVTNPSGVAVTRLTLGSRVGLYQVTAISGVLPPHVFNAQALAGLPALIAEAAGGGQQKTVTALLDTALTARITDIGGNPIQGVAVQFSIAQVPTGATGTSLSANADTTDINGEASTMLTLGTVTGSYVVIANSPALAADSALFTVQATAAAAAQVLSLSGDAQTQPAGASLPQPFVVTVLDVFGNPVPGAAVQFTITSIPAGATGQQITPSTSVTNAAGQAQAVLRLGTLPGAYVTTATVTGLPATQFTANASFILADLNSDFDVNIADLTSIIDHILERRVLTGIDSAKADVNRDGSINVLDVVVVQNALLGTGSLPKNGAAKSVGTAVNNSATAAAAISATLEITPLGVRLNITNDVPLKGIQLAVALRTTSSVNRTDVVFPRARDMQFFVNSAGSEVRLLAYNLQNVPIDTGSGSIVRLPIMLADTSDVDSVYAIVSTADTSFDLAIRIPMSTTQSVYPATFRLYQNYPNPFNSETNIQFEVPDVQGKFVRTLVQVFNLLGEKVKTLARGEHTAGVYRVTWDGTDDHGNKVPSGAYFYRLVSGDYVSAKRMILIK